MNETAEMRNPTHDENLVKIQLGPGELLTLDGRRACDGAILTLEVQGTGKNVRVVSATFDEVHDMRRAGHRTLKETEEHLRRCLKLLLSEGIMILKGEEPVMLRASEVNASPSLIRRLYQLPESRESPFPLVDEPES